MWHLFCEHLRPVGRTYGIVAPDERQRARQNRAELVAHIIGRRLDATLGVGVHADGLAQRREVRSAASSCAMLAVVRSAAPSLRLASLRRLRTVPTGTPRSAAIWPYAET